MTTAPPIPGEPVELYRLEIIAQHMDD